MAADLRWSPKKIDQMMTALETRNSSPTIWTPIPFSLECAQISEPGECNQSEACLRRIKELPKSSIVREFQVVARKHCYRKGASASAQAFAQLFDKLLLEHFNEQLYPATLLIFKSHLH